MSLKIPRPILAAIVFSAGLGAVVAILMGGNLSSPAETGSFSARQETDRAAQDQRGEDENGKTGLAANAARMLPINPDTLAAGRAASRLAMLRRFLTAGRAMLLHLSPISRARRSRRSRRSRRGKAKGKGKGTAGGSAAQLRTGQHRDDKRAAMLQRIVGRQPKEAPAAPNRPQPEGVKNASFPLRPR